MFVIHGNITAKVRRGDYAVKIYLISNYTLKGGIYLVGDGVSGQIRHELNERETLHYIVLQIQ
jgi:hypothetical protein